MMDHLVHGSKQYPITFYMAKVSKLERILRSKQTKQCTIISSKNKQCTIKNTFENDNI